VAAAVLGAGVVAVDVKGDFLMEMRDAKRRMNVREKIGHFVWDIDAPVTSRSWNPLGEVRDSRSAAQLAQAFLGDVDPRDPQRYFAERDHRWMAGLIWLTVSAYGPTVHPATLFALATSQQWLSQAVARAPHAAHNVADLVQFNQSEFAKVTAGLANRLSWMADPAVADVLSGAGPRAFTLGDVLSQRAVLVVGARVAGGERSAIAASLILNALRMRALDSFAGGQVPLLWILDEAARYADRVHLDVMLDVLRGASSPVCVGLQDVTHLGDERTQSKFLSNCDTFLALAGCSHATADFLSKRLGTVQGAKASRSLNGQNVFAPTLSHEEKPILGNREIMNPPVGAFGGVAHLRSSSSFPFLFSFG